MERYTRVFKLTEKTYQEGAPVIIVAGGLLKDNQSETILAQLKFENITDKKITAIKIRIEAFDILGNPVQGIEEYQYLDLALTKNGDFGEQIPIIMPNPNTRSIKPQIVAVISEDAVVWEANSNSIPIVVPEQKDIHEFFSGEEIKEQYIRETTQRAMYVPKELQNIWLCTCGSINGQELKECKCCATKKRDVFENLNEKILLTKLDEYKIECAKEAAKQEEAAKRSAERKKKNIKKMLQVGGIILCFILVVSVGVKVYNNISINNQYQEAITIDQGTEEEYLEAIEILEGLNGYKESDEYITKYQKQILHLRTLNICESFESEYIASGNIKELITDIEEITENWYTNSEDSKQLEPIYDFARFLKRIYVEKVKPDDLLEALYHTNYLQIDDYELADLKPYLDYDLGKILYQKMSEYEDYLGRTYEAESHGEGWGDEFFSCKTTLGFSLKDKNEGITYDNVEIEIVCSMEHIGMDSSGELLNEEPRRLAGYGAVQDLKKVPVNLRHWDFDVKYDYLDISLDKVFFYSYDENASDGVVLRHKR